MISEKEVQNLKDKIAELEKEVARLKNVEKELEKTKNDFEEFKSLHASTVDNLKQALKIKADSRIVSKPLGAPIGHKGYTRHVPEHFDIVRELIVNKCPECNARLGETQEVRSRYVTDIRLKLDVINTRYDIHRKYCCKCKKLVEPEIPNVLPHARFGLNLMLMVMYLKLGLRLSNQKVCEYFMTMANLKISDGEISLILKQLAREYADYYVYLKKLLTMSRVKHTDSTSWRVNGKNYFAWVFITTGIVIYNISKHNNHKVALALFKKQQGKILVVDRHSAFRTLAEKSGFLLQLCWSHILADTKDLAKNFGSEGKYVHKHLKEIYALAKMLEHKGTIEEIEQLQGEILQLTTRHYKHTTIRRFVNNLYNRDIENLFRFVNDPEIDATNNISERELRELVIIRHISKQSKSTRGANTTAILLSIIQTLRIRKENVLQGLQAILKKPSGY
jgi:prefoldin subunit 5